MKNKDKYDLTKLEIKANYHIDGCGRKIPDYIYVDIFYEGKVLMKEHKTKENLYKFLMEWLEQ